LIPSDSFFFLPRLSGKTIFSESQSSGAGGRNDSVTCYRTIGINWNFGTLGTCIRPKRFERTPDWILGIERLERFELAPVKRSRLHGFSRELATWWVRVGRD
jgi:hypothetical protein